MSCKYSNEQQHLPRNFTKRTVSWTAQTNRLTLSNLSKRFMWEKTKCVFDYCLSLLKLCYNMAVQCKIMFLLRVELNQQVALWRNNAHALLLMFSAACLWSFNLLENVWNVLVWIPPFCNNGVLKFWFIIFIMTRGKEKTGQITTTNVCYLVVFLWRSIGFHCAEMSLVEVWIRTWLKNKKKSISYLKLRVMVVGWWTNGYIEKNNYWVDQHHHDLEKQRFMTH